MNNLQKKIYEYKIFDNPIRDAIFKRVLKKFEISILDNDVLQDIIGTIYKHVKYMKINLTNEKEYKFNEDVGVTYCYLSVLYYVTDRYTKNSYDIERLDNGDIRIRLQLQSQRYVNPYFALCWFEYIQKLQSENLLQKFRDFFVKDKYIENYENRKARNKILFLAKEYLPNL